MLKDWKVNVAPVLKNVELDPSNYKLVSLMFVPGKLQDLTIKENHTGIQTLLKENLQGFCKQILFYQSGNFKEHEERVWMKVTLHS